MSKIGLGDDVKCTVTGFRGIVTGVTTYMHSTPILLVQPPCTEPNKWEKGQWLDEARLALALVNDTSTEEN